MEQSELGQRGREPAVLSREAQQVEEPVGHLVADDVLPPAGFGAGPLVTDTVPFVTPTRVAMSTTRA